MGGSHASPHHLVPASHRNEFILSGHPHLEEAYWFAEGVLPILRGKGVA
ncbi:hypothetical protein [Mycobacterium sp. 4858]|nr:hypothetical protein [Mycobacterium sp. 4858]